ILQAREFFRQFGKHRARVRIEQVGRLFIDLKGALGKEKTCSVKEFNQCLCAFLKAGHGSAKLRLALLIHTVEKLLASLQIGQSGEEDAQQRVILRSADVNAVQRLQFLEIEPGGSLVD